MKCRFCWKKNWKWKNNNYFCSNVCQSYFYLNNWLTKQQILNKTKFLKINATLKERTYCIKHKIKERAKCKFCWKELKFTKHWYLNTCSISCSLYFKQVNISKQELIKRTNFLPYKASISERVYYIKNNIKERIKCKFCWKNLLFDNKKKKYNKFCSNSCSKNFEKLEITKQEILKRTKFLNKKSNIKERIYCIKFNIKNQPKCKFCWKELKFRGHSYSETCSKSCWLYYKSSNWLNKKEILDKTKFLNWKKQNISLTERIYCIKKNITRIKKCKFCNKEISFKDWYSDTCSLICWNYYFKLNITKKELTNKTKFLPKNINLDIRYYYYRNWLKWIIYCKKCNWRKIYKSWNNITCKKKCIWNSIENEIVEYILSLNKDIKIIQNDRNVLNWRELDIYLPQHWIAIEYNWLMWHSIWKHKSSKFNNYEWKVEHLKYNHYNKTIKCQNKWIKLFHIFENEWLNKLKKNIWKNILKKQILK